METMKRALAICGALFLALAGPAPAVADELQFSASLIEVFDHKATRTGILNPDNILDQRGLGSETALVTETRWQGLALRLRMAEEFQHHDGGWRKTDDLDLQELSYEFNLPSRYRLSVGKLSEAWHVGYAFHPLGFFEPQLNRDDLSERFKRNEGVPAIVSGYLADNWDFTLAYSNDFKNSRDGFNKGLHQWAARVGMLTDNGMEYSLVAQKPEGQNIGFGGTGVQVFGNDLEVHGSIFLRQGTRRPLHSAVRNNQLVFETENPYQAFRIDDDKWYARSVVGLQWTSADLVNVILEWNHDGRGLDDQRWEQWKDLVRFHANGADLGVSNTAINGNLKFDAETLLESGARQDYVFLRLSKGGGDWSPEVSVLVSVADGGAMWNARLAYTAATTWEAEVFSRISSGSSGSEFSMGPNKGSFGVGFRYHF